MNRATEFAVRCFMVSAVLASVAACRQSEPTRSPSGVTVVQFTVDGESMGIGFHPTAASTTVLLASAQATEVCEADALGSTALEGMCGRLDRNEPYHFHRTDGATHVGVRVSQAEVSGSLTFTLEYRDADGYLVFRPDGPASACWLNAADLAAVAVASDSPGEVEYRRDDSTGHVQLSSDGVEEALPLPDRPATTFCVSVESDGEDGPPPLYVSVERTRASPEL